MKNGAFWALLTALFVAALIARRGMLAMLVFILALAALVSAQWARHSLDRLTYRRRLGSAWLAYGEETTYTLEFTNAKLLPLGWLLVQDGFPQGVQLLTAAPRLTITRETGRLVTFLSLRWYERVTHTYRIQGAHRGRYQLGPAELSSGDVFGFHRVSRLDKDETAYLTVYPKIAPVQALGLPAGRPLGAWLWQVGQILGGLGDFTEGFPATLLVALQAAAVWAAGLAIDWSWHDDLWRDFVCGVVALGLLLLLPQAWCGQSDATLGAAVAQFLLFGLLALALLAVGNVFSIQRTRGRGTPALSRYWLGTLGLTILLILGVGGLIGLALSPETMRQLLQYLAPIGRFLLQVLRYILMAVAYVILGLLAPLFDLKQNAAPETEASELELPRSYAEQLAELAPPAAKSGGLSPQVIATLLIVGLVVLLALLFAWAWRRRHGVVRSSAAIEERTSIWSSALFWSQLRALFAHRQKETAAPFLGALDAADPRQAIRALYRRLLTRARTLGRPRPPGQTPTAYGAALETLLPAGREALATLTAAYEVARYAPEAPAGALVDDATAAMAQLDDLLDEAKA